MASTQQSNPKSQRALQLSSSRHHQDDRRVMARPDSTTITEEPRPRTSSIILETPVESSIQAMERLGITKPATESLDLQRTQPLAAAHTTVIDELEPPQSMESLTTTPPGSPSTTPPGSPSTTPPGSPSTTPRGSPSGHILFGCKPQHSTKQSDVLPTRDEFITYYVLLLHPVPTAIWLDKLDTGRAAKGFDMVRLDACGCKPYLKGSLEWFRRVRSDGYYCNICPGCSKVLYQETRPEEQESPLWGLALEKEKARKHA
ncbi:hypothetical protein K490DRAFT_65620 [Saccharata proteae CBS 121410]|uniref:Uncharacterized protein n=1 Tax=Saccharata proteae CBS 121410 TaxID=1314787 RepID=A0A9P4LZ60_9PEZI|nr:hypothetical protein K490DRAFT_65620 [Saccharata proteae CBS 121410]